MHREDRIIGMDISRAHLDIAAGENGTQHRSGC